ncbi:hypothetical protein SARC_09968 [Sphaeroforma arctica JP610]|uniref:Uncharacterized protein n=1 Tax=Sphaeroforma arctica JP610 TaxID=667725 RepID=A0A0L0FLF6_9EUKA|nr:hypothetical protein SARC_09968 [Sphaeroforma arctica JP610]KNC77575.1 hypothetical protein SARC_09968 [Sphaeroforma arctica JP610]|eukprot:XP_014151477.1 hypothetical protein SARC_09968 [Sphaeroforma arctica JP610]
MALGNEKKLLQQLCWEIGFKPDRIAQYVSGEQREMLLNFPEMEYYRDIVFMFKFMMTPTSSALPPIRPYNQNHADLTWRWKGDKEPVWEVKAFEQVLLCTPPTTDKEKDKKGLWARLMKSMSKDLRAGPSGADPTSLLNATVEGEEDVLHVKV